MQLTAESKSRLGTALNEATLTGMTLDPATRTARVSFAVLTLPEVGRAAIPSEIQLVLAPVGRLVASWRDGDWNDATAAVVPFTTERLDEVVRSFGGQPIYGWEFFDARETDFAMWSDRLSLDWRAREARDGMLHTLDVFQEGVGRHLDVRIWFDRLEIRDAEDRAIDGAEFCAGGERWWRSLQAGDARTAGHGIAALRADVPGEVDAVRSIDAPRRAAAWTRRDAGLGALFVGAGLLVVAYAYSAMRNGMPALLWGAGWMLGPLLLLLGGNALWRALRADA